MGTLWSIALYNNESEGGLGSETDQGLSAACDCFPSCIFLDPSWVSDVEQKAHPGEHTDWESLRAHCDQGICNLGREGGDGGEKMAWNEMVKCSILPVATAWPKTGPQDI